MSISLARRALAGGTLALAALTLATPAADAATYSPGIPGSVGVAAQWSTSKTAFDVNYPQPVVRGDDLVKGTDAASSGTASWPPTPGPVIPPPVACTDGCASSDVTAFASAQAGGVLQVFARGTSGATGMHRASATSESSAFLDDTITVDKPTTILVKGRVRARLDRDSATDTRAGSTSILDLDIVAGQCQDEGCSTQRLARDYEADGSGTDVVDEPFEQAIALPAGTSPFNAELRARVASWVGEDLQHTGSAGASGKSDAATNGEDADRVELQVVVPDDVVVTSGSGKLPILGGRPPQPTDTTPPVITAPTGVTLDATGPTGAIARYTVTAVDETSTAQLSCTPASGTRFAAGKTTVSCKATDAAGNAATKSFVVTVRSAADLLDALRAEVNALQSRGARNALLPLIPAGSQPTCARMLLFGARLVTLLPRQLDLTTGLHLLESASRVARAAGCR